MDEEKAEIKKEEPNKTTLPRVKAISKFKNKKTLAISLLIIIVLVSIIILGLIIMSLSQEDDSLYSYEETEFENAEQVENNQVVEAGIYTGRSINPRDATPSAEITQYYVYNIIFPFVRDDDIYLYENGKEELIISKPQDRNFDLENDWNAIINKNSTPRISADSKHIAYLEFDNLISEGYDYPDGELKIYNISDKSIDSTGFEARNFKWLSANEIGYSTWDKSEQVWKLKDYKYNIYSKNNSTSAQKEVIENEDSFIIINNLNNSRKVFNREKYSIEGFVDWSPDYKYAIFSTKNYKVNPSGYFGLDTDENNQNFIPIKVNNPSLGAGGEQGVGTKWYFNKGFLLYCEQEIWFVDGREPIELTHSGGGGCHNEDGFVETSPNGEYAFLKLDDRFELHTKSTGMKQKVNEEFYIEKTRLNSYLFTWINDDYMLIAAVENWIERNSTHNIYVFDRINNEIKPVVKDGMLY